MKSMRWHVPNGNPVSGYTGFTCYAAPDVTLEDDLKRRDLTINALAQDDNGEIIDPYNGWRSANRLLRHVSPLLAKIVTRIARGAFCCALCPPRFSYCR